MNLPTAIRDVIGEELQSCQDVGLEVSESLYDAVHFGNFFVDLAMRDFSIRVVRNRGLFELHGQREILEEAGLWRAFESKDEMFTALLAFVTANA